MDVVYWLIILIFALINLGVLYWIYTKSQKESKTEKKSLSAEEFSASQEKFKKGVFEELTKYNFQVEALKKQIEQTQKNLQEKQTVTNTLSEQLSKAVTGVSSVKENLLNEYQKTKENYGDLHAELNKFNRLLSGSATKTGKLFEVNLKIVLTNFFSGSNEGTLKEQYALKNGKIVDYMILTENENIPIDSKFNISKYSAVLEAKTKEEKDRLSLEFIQQLRSIIKELKEKYISPPDNTKNVLLYVPSQTIFEWIYTNWDDCARFLNQHKVWLTAPITIIPTITLISRFSLQYRQLRNANDISKRLEIQQKQLQKLSEDWDDYWKRTEYALKAGEKLGKRIEMNVSSVDKIIKLGTPETKKIN